MFVTELCCQEDKNNNRWWEHKECKKKKERFGFVFRGTFVFFSFRSVETERAIFR